MITQQIEAQPFILGEGPQREHRVAGDSKNPGSHRRQLVGMITDLRQLATADPGECPWIEMITTGLPRSAESLIDSPC
jgi:hypothetical protein